MWKLEEIGDAFIERQHNGLYFYSVEERWVDGGGDSRVVERLRYVRYGANFITAQMWFQWCHLVEQANQAEVSTTD